MVAALLCAGLLCSGAVARAQPEEPPAPDEPAAPEDDPSFGPVLEIERIDIEGNEWSADRVIVRALPVKVGDVLHAGDPKLQQARFKLLALGYFRSVELSLQRGSEHGKVVLRVQVVERGTVVLEQLHFGTSRMTPAWGGADVSERNFLGTGVSVGAGALGASSGAIDGHRAQWGVQARFADESVLGTSLGVHAGFLHRRASEPYRIAGEPDDDDPSLFRAFPYSRTGGSAGVSLAATPLTRVAADLRVEHVRASPPAAPTRELPGGEVVPVDVHLPAGSSRLVAVALGFDRDTRADPVLPWSGDRFVVLVQGGTEIIGGSWDFVTAMARYGHWWPVRGPAHVVSVHLQGGAVFGDAPVFERLYVGDFDRWQTPRAFGMVVSTEASADLLRTGADDLVYGDLGGSLAVEYSYRLFRRHKHIYGGDLFVGGGLWTMGDLDRPEDPDRSLAEAMVVDLYVDAGLRLDTEIGVFELTLANALGRVPF